MVASRSQGAGNAAPVAGVKREGQDSPGPSSGKKARTGQAAGEAITATELRQKLVEDVLAVGQRIEQGRENGAALLWTSKQLGADIVALRKKLADKIREQNEVDSAFHTEVELVVSLEEDLKKAKTRVLDCDRAEQVLRDLQSAPALGKP